MATGSIFYQIPSARRPVTTSTFALTRNTPKRTTASSASATNTTPALFRLLSIPRMAMAAASSVAQRTMLTAASPPVRFIFFQPAWPRGDLDFGQVFTDKPRAQGNGGSGFASFLVGLSDGGRINNLHNIHYPRPLFAFYVPDDWKVTRKLTLNLGLRYEL